MKKQLLTVLFALMLSTSARALIPDRLGRRLKPPEGLNLIPRFLPRLNELLSDVLFNISFYVVLRFGGQQ